MIHRLKFSPGTDLHDKHVRCSCGWSFSSTYKEVRRVGGLHEHQNSRFAWHDERRADEPVLKWWAA